MVPDKTVPFLSVLAETELVLGSRWEPPMEAEVIDCSIFRTYEEIPGRIPRKYWEVNRFHLKST